MTIPYEYIWAVLGGYLLGSMPSGLILTRLWGGVDLRKIGSGNIGATNVLRTGKKSLAVLTLILDALKAYLPMEIAKLYMPELAIYIGLFAVIGHCFPLWLGFKGGKGVSSALGVYFGLSPLLGGFVLLIWLLIAALTRYSSLSALVAALASVFLASVMLPLHQTFGVAAMVFLIVYKHRDNIRRLLQGQEPKIGAK